MGRWLLVVGVGIMVQGQVDPRPPATVDLALKDMVPDLAAPFARDASARSVSGRLVAATDQAWYLTSAEPQAPADMLSVGRDDATAAVTRATEREIDSVGEVVWDWVR